VQQKTKASYNQQINDKIMNVYQPTVNPNFIKQINRIIFTEVYTKTVNFTMSSEE
jgi:hypothetical protein